MCLNLIILGKCKVLLMLLKGTPQADEFQAHFLRRRNNLFLTERDIESDFQSSLSLFWRKHRENTMKGFNGSAKDLSWLQYFVLLR